MNLFSWLPESKTMQRKQIVRKLQQPPNDVIFTTLKGHYSHQQQKHSTNIFTRLRKRRRDQVHTVQSNSY